MSKFLRIWILGFGMSFAAAATAQEVVPQSSLSAAPSNAVINTPVPAGTAISTPISPDTPQTPGSSVIYVPQGTPAVVTPTTGLGYAPLAPSKIAVSHDSIITRFADGSKAEIDSDNAVFMVYPDGARVAAQDGIHKMMDGSSITVRNGHRMP